MNQGKFMTLDPILRKLMQSSIESSVYIALLHPKTQTEVRKTVYSMKQGRRTIVGAMNNLEGATYIKSLNPPIKTEKWINNELVKNEKKHRKNEKFIATLEPFVKYVKYNYDNSIADFIVNKKAFLPDAYKISYRKKILNSGRITGFSDDDAYVLDKIVSSKWFRSFLDTTAIDKIDYPLTNLNRVPMQWTSYRDGNGVLRFSIKQDAIFVDGFRTIKIGAMQLLGYLFKDIAMKLTIPFLELPSLNKKMPKLEDLKHIQNFDEFAAGWVKKNFNEDKEFIINAIKNSGNIIASEYNTPHTSSKISVSTSSSGESVFSEKELSKSIKHIELPLVSKEEIGIRLMYAKNLYFLCIPRDLAIKVESSIFKNASNQYTSIGIQFLIKKQQKYLKYLNEN